MTAKEYAELMKLILKMQINYILEDPDYEESEHLQGQEVGLRIAIEKIEQSSFLFER